ncbi:MULTISPECIES: 2OG-Fe(II) oxygenase [unclassified Acinetobacter]|uniref:2OG-Fe(II) oxygenase n=1 Tax=unclassified Acinetobacter TaxID=196816 RepID=UPI00190D4A60|nr:MULTISPECIES: 2OG-Fe(II) oxygenase [unclassified Acinetobacter]MBK0064128.1 2OG-Fe(II) oxygenase [Acinetobacter sp. S55]MBK0067680.1 2OG-Fe(II) oxygenase [Acinetobacter sp. S54]
MQQIIESIQHDIEQILDDLDQYGFAIVNQTHSAQFALGLLEECLSNLNQFREAAIQSGVVSKIRSDHILWIDEKLRMAQQHIKLLQEFSEAFNRAFFMGIQTIEAHFACYNAGEFYALHRDNPQKKNDRMISAVYYLHSEWQSDWGGQLRLQDKNDHWHMIEPEPNRMVIFQSDLLHEVLISKRQRLSITAWLRSGHSIWSSE